MNLISRSAERIGIDAAGAKLALRLAIAALLAFSIAAVLHIPNAYWAAMPIWVVTQNARGLLIERGLYRIAGTLTGAAAGLGILYCTDNTYLALALLAAWVMTFAGLNALPRGVAAYGALMAGMTAAVVVLPSVLAPERIVDLALARVACTLIGVVVVTVVTGFFTPAARREDFYQRVRRLAGDSTDYAAQAVSGRSAEEIHPLERRVLAEMADVDAAAPGVAAGSRDGYRRLAHTTDIVAACIALMAAAAALRGRRLRGQPIDETLADRLALQAAKLRSRDRAPTFDDSSWAPVVEADSPQERVHRAMHWLVSAEAALFDQTPQADARAFSPRAKAYLPPHRDWRQAVTSGLVAGLATFFASSLGYASGWAAAELAALGVCIFSLVLGSLPNPRLIAPKLLVGVTAGVIAATFYRLAIQPHLAGPAQVILSVAPFIVIGALARVSRFTAIPALDAIMCFMLGSQASMPAAPTIEIINGSAALMMAATLVAGGFMLTRDRTAERSRALSGDIRRHVARLFNHPPADHATLPGQWHAQAARQILRLLLELQRAGRTADAPDGLLAALNLGHAVTRLQLAVAELSVTDRRREPLRKALAALASFETGSDQAVATALLAAKDISDQPANPDKAVLTDAATQSAIENIHDAVEALRWGEAAWRG